MGRTEGKDVHKDGQGLCSPISKKKRLARVEDGAKSLAPFIPSRPGPCISPLA